MREKNKYEKISVKTSRSHQDTMSKTCTFSLIAQTYTHRSSAQSTHTHLSNYGPFDACFYQNPHVNWYKQTNIC